MKATLTTLGLVFTVATATAATITVGPWTPIFKGVDLASGQQQAVTAGELDQRVLCLRVDLADPDISLFTTPKCTNCSNLETVSENTSHFLEQYGVQAAINGGFYSSSSGPSDTALGTPDDVYGLAICTGAVVSAANTAGYVASMLFTTNNQPIYLPTNSPATNTTGIYTAISGNNALLLNGVNLRAATPNDLDPRTAIGISADRRYLFLMTIDGRDNAWSDGADFHDTGEWLLRFGASDGINVDGGGSTTMAMADCQGKSIRLNQSSFMKAYGRERNIGHNFGVRALPLPSDLKGLVVTPSTTTATITWRTDVPATTQVEYGTTATLGTATPHDSRLLRNHVATIAGLSQGSNYFFRAISTADGLQYTQSCQFATARLMTSTQIFGLTKSWSYTTNNLDGVSWKAPGYNDAGWLGSGSGLLYVQENSASVSPKTTVMPPVSGAIPRTYYFRTHFNFAGSTTGASLIFSNYVDDGAVFYLNGVEIYRLRVAAAPTVITYITAANGTPCAGTPQSGDANTTCPDVFTISGNLLTNLVQGDNVLAVEVHNYTSGADLVFGSALIASAPVLVIPRVDLWAESGTGTLFWNGEGFTLQQTSDLRTNANWTDVPGPVTRSPYVVTNAASVYYRLRN